MADKLARDLYLLESAELVRALSEPDWTYIFKHALIQDAAYSSLLKNERRILHRLVGETMERLYADRLDENASLLARHFEVAGDEEKTLEYLIRAGDAASRVYANVEAIAHYSRALEIAASSHAPIGADRLRHLYSSRGSLYELSDQYPLALSNYEKLEQAARARADQSLLLVALLAQAKIYATPNPQHDPRQAGALLDQALDLARALHDRVSESRVLWNLMLLDLWNHANYSRAIQRGEQSLALARELGLDEQCAYALNDLAYCHVATNDWAGAESIALEAQRLWRALKILPMLADNLSNLVLMYFNDGRFEEAIGASDEAFALSQTTNNLWGQTNSRHFVGNVYLEWGRLDEAMSVMRPAIALGDQVGHPAPMVWTRCDLARTYALLGLPKLGLEIAMAALEKADGHSYGVAPLAIIALVHLLAGDLTACEAALKEGYALLQPVGIRWYAPTFLALVGGELALARQNHADAIQIIGDLMGHLQTAPRGPYVADALHCRAKALRAQGRLLEARETWRQSREIAQSLGSRRSLLPILIESSDLESELGDPAAADRLRVQARGVAEFIAGHTSDPELRASFLSQSYIRRLFDEGSSG